MKPVEMRRIELLSKHFKSTVDRLRKFVPKIHGAIRNKNNSASPRYVTGNFLSGVGRPMPLIL